MVVVASSYFLNLKYLPLLLLHLFVLLDGCCGADVVWCKISWMDESWLWVRDIRLLFCITVSGMCLWFGFLVGWFYGWVWVKTKNYLQGNFCEPLQIFMVYLFLSDMKIFTCLRGMVVTPSFLSSTAFMTNLSCIIVRDRVLDKLELVSVISLILTVHNWWSPNQIGNRNRLEGKIPFLG